MSQGLRRFVDPPPPKADPPVPGVAREKPKAAPGEVCEMCVEPLGDAHSHSHVVNLDTRQIMCTCRACYLLFTHQGAAGGRYRAVPDRYLHDQAFGLDEVVINTWAHDPAVRRTSYALLAEAFSLSAVLICTL